MHSLPLKGGKAVYVVPISLMVMEANLGQLTQYWLLFCQSKEVPQFGFLISRSKVSSIDRLKHLSNFDIQISFTKLNIL